MKVQRRSCCCSPFFVKCPRDHRSLPFCMFYISELLQSLSPWRVNSYLKCFFVSHQVHIACDGRNGGVKHQVYPRSAEKHFLNVTYGELSAIVAVIYASTDCLTAIILDYLFSCSFTPSVFSLSCSKTSCASALTSWKTTTGSKPHLCPLAPTLRGQSLLSGATVALVCSPSFSW